MPDTLANKVIAYLQQDETEYNEAAKLGPEALPILKNIITGNDEMLSSKATYLASLINGPGKEDALMTAAVHASPIVRVAAANAAQTLETTKAEQLLNTLINDSDVGVSKYSLRSIKAAGLSQKFSDRIKVISTQNPNEHLKTLATDMLRNN